MIPIFMIVQGSVYIVKTIIDVAVRYYQSRKRCRGCQDDNNEEDDGHTKRGNWLSRLLGLFLFGFFIAGRPALYCNSDNLVTRQDCPCYLYMNMRAWLPSYSIELH